MIHIIVKSLRFNNEHYMEFSCLSKYPWPEFLKKINVVENIFMHKSRWVVKWLWSFQASWKKHVETIFILHISQNLALTIFTYFDMTWINALNFDTSNHAWFKWLQSFDILSQNFNNIIGSWLFKKKKPKIQASIYQEIGNFFNTQ